MRKVNISRAVFTQPLRRLGFTLLLSSMAPAVQAAAADSLALVDTEARAVPPRPLPLDRSTALLPRRADAERLRDLAGQREFQYRETELELGFWERFWNRVWAWLSTLSNTKKGRFTWKYGTYAAMAAILVFAVLKLLKVDVGGAFGRKPRRAHLPYDVEGENIHEVDFPTRIAEAEAAGDFRLATRLGYLAVLKTLSDQGLINWQPDKTNHAYLHELSNNELRSSFREATQQFEYVWYGELPLAAALYQQVRASQQAVTAPLRSRRASTLTPTA